jgi:hypothetical protein
MREQIVAVRNAFRPEIEGTSSGGFLLFWWCLVEVEREAKPVLGV